MNVQKIGELSRWKNYPEKGVLFFDGPSMAEAHIRLHVASPRKVDWYVLNSAKEVEFYLASTEGLATLDFYPGGPVVLATVGEDVRYWSGHFEPTHVEIDDPVIFTGLENRRARNPELEMMQRAARINMEAVADSIARTYEQKFSALQRQIEEGANERVITQAPGAAANKPNEIPDEGGDDDASSNGVGAGSEVSGGGNKPVQSADAGGAGKRKPAAAKV